MCTQTGSKALQVGFPRECDIAVSEGVGIGETGETGGAGDGVGSFIEWREGDLRHIWELFFPAVVFEGGRSGAMEASGSGVGGRWREGSAGGERAQDGDLRLPEHRGCDGGR